MKMNFLFSENILFTIFSHCKGHTHTNTLDIKLNIYLDIIIIAHTDTHTQNQYAQDFCRFKTHKIDKNNNISYSFTHKYTVTAVVKNRITLIKLKNKQKPQFEKKQQEISHTHTQYTQCPVYSTFSIFFLDLDQQQKKTTHTGHIHMKKKL